MLKLILLHFVGGCFQWTSLEETAPLVYDKRLTPISFIPIFFIQVFFSVESQFVWLKILIGLQMSWTRRYVLTHFYSTWFLLKLKKVLVISQIVNIPQKLTIIRRLWLRFSCSFGFTVAILSKWFFLHVRNMLFCCFIKFRFLEIRSYLSWWVKNALDSHVCIREWK